MFENRKEDKQDFFQVENSMFVSLDFENTQNITNKKNSENNFAKPFLKWAGGKGQLINIISSYYPFSQKITKYVEPFVGGGAVLFDILNNFVLEEIYINDCNQELITAYTCIKNNVDDVITLLYQLQKEFLLLNTEERKKYYQQKREQFNNKKTLSKLEQTSLLLFLNKTCFNGLYRVNRKKEFNVPMGAYKNPLICNEQNLRLVSEKLQNVIISCGDYKDLITIIDNKTFVYFDPPYRPITQTASFTSYTENEFSDNQQKELASFIDTVNEIGAKFLLSNSDPKNYDENDNFFDELYAKYWIKRVEATRMINCKSEARGKIKELLITNFIEE